MTLYKNSDGGRTKMKSLSAAAFEDCCCCWLLRDCAEIEDDLVVNNEVCLGHEIGEVALIGEVCYELIERCICGEGATTPTVDEWYATCEECLPPTCPTDCTSFATKLVKFVLSGTYRIAADDGLGHCIAYTCNYVPCEGDGYLTVLPPTLTSNALTRTGCTWAGGADVYIVCDQGIIVEIPAEVWCVDGVWYCEINGTPFPSQRLLFARTDDGSHSPAGVYTLIERGSGGLDCTLGSPALEITVEDAP